MWAKFPRIIMWMEKHTPMFLYVSYKLKIDRPSFEAIILKRCRLKDLKSKRSSILH